MGCRPGRLSSPLPPIAGDVVVDGGANRLRLELRLWKEALDTRHESRVEVTRRASDVGFSGERGLQERIGRSNVLLVHGLLLDLHPVPRGPGHLTMLEEPLGGQDCRCRARTAYR